MMFAHLPVLFGLFCCLYAESAVSDSSKPCTWGPSYWCSSVKSAKDCGAVQFCIRNTWRQSSFVQGIHDDNTCVFCKKLVIDIRDFVSADQTEQAIIAFADKACMALPQKFMQEECKGIANLYIVQIISMLRQDMDPAAVCHAINLCATSDMFMAHTNYRSNFAVSQAALTYMAVDKLKTAKVDGIFRVLADSTAKHGSSLKESQLRPFIGTAADQCNVCKQGVEDLKIVFANSQVRDEVAQILKTNICPRFIMPAECKKLIDEYAPEVFQVIVNLDPTAACETIGLCTVTDGKPLVMPMADIKPAIRPVRTVEVETNAKASVQCIMCEYVISTIVSALADNTTDQKVIEVVTHICDVMPKSVKTQCQYFINTYGEELIDLFTHSADPQTICTILGLCNAAHEQENVEEPQKTGMSLDSLDFSSAVEAFTNIGPVLNAFAENQYDGRTKSGEAKKLPIDLPFDFDPKNMCYMCRLVANYLVTLIKEQYVSDTFQTALNKVCTFLPEKFSGQCKDFVHQYTPRIILALVGSLNTQEICQGIDVCPAREAYFPKPNGEEIVVGPIAF